MNIDELRRRCHAVIQIQEIVAHALSHFSGLTDTELARFLEGTFTPSDEQLQKLEDRLIYEEQNQPRIQGHGVPRSDESMIETLIYNVGKEKIGLTFDQIVELFSSDREKAEQLIEKACNDGLLGYTPPAGFNREFVPSYYYLTKRGKAIFERFPSEQSLNFPRF